MVCIENFDLCLVLIQLVPNSLKVGKTFPMCRTATAPTFAALLSSALL
jgi:hypothetical protein